jgi:hypothetical protein
LHPTYLEDFADFEENSYGFLALSTHLPWFVRYSRLTYIPGAGAHTDAKPGSKTGGQAACTNA